MAELFGLVMTMLNGAWPVILFAFPYLILIFAARGIRESGTDSLEDIEDGVQQGLGQLTGPAARHIVYGSMLAGAVGVVSGTMLVPAALLLVIGVHGLVRTGNGPIEHQVLRPASVAVIVVAIGAGVFHANILQAGCVLYVYGSIFWRI